MLNRSKSKFAKKHLHFNVKIYYRRFFYCLFWNLFLVVADVSWLSKQIPLSKIRRPTRGLRVSAEIRSECWVEHVGNSFIIFLSLPSIFPLWMFRFVSRGGGGLYAEEETDKNKMLWSMHGLCWLLRFIYSRAHMMAARILAVLGGEGEDWSPCLLLSVLLPQY